MAVKAADVQPIKHGRWKYYKNNGIIDTYICTNCENKVEMAIDVEPSSYCYCPKCGALMKQ
jgi:DNA-directed RNA polymerase subunit RPC12/RpoP